MRKEVKVLWEFVNDPNNKDSLYDYMNFIRLVMNGEITDSEVQECMEML